MGDYSLQCALIYVVTHIGGFRISEAVVQAAARPIGAAAAGHAIRHTTYRCITELYLYLRDDVGLLGKGQIDETCDILIPNELKNAEHLTVRLGLQ